MELKTRDNQLTLGSVFKLFVTGWLCAWTVFAGVIFLLLLVIGVATGSMLVNGEVVQGRGTVLLAMAPAFILLPIVIVIQAIMFAAFLTGGVWLYRLRRPLTVVSEATAPST